MGKGELGWTLYLLQMTGMVEGCVFLPPRPDSPGNLMGVNRANLMLTPKGFEAAGRMVDCAGSTEAKLQALWTLLRDVGCGVMANIVYQWLN